MEPISEEYEEGKPLGWDGEGEICFVKSARGSGCNIVVQVSGNPHEFKVTSATLGVPGVREKLQAVLEEAKSGEGVTYAKHASEGKLVLYSSKDEDGGAEHCKVKTRLKLLLKSLTKKPKGRPKRTKDESEDDVDEEDDDNDEDEDRQRSKPQGATKKERALPAALDVDLDLDALLATGVTDPAQRANATTMFLARYRDYQADDEKQGELNQQTITLVQDALRGEDMYLHSSSTAPAFEAAKLLDRRVIFQNPAPSEPDAKVAATTEMFLVDFVQQDHGNARPSRAKASPESLVPNRPTWVRVSRVANLMDVLPEFFVGEMDKFNKNFCDFTGQEEVKECLVDLLIKALKGPAAYMSRFKEKCFAFLGRPGTGKTTAASLFATADWLFGTSRFGHMLTCGGPALQAPYAGQNDQKVRNAIAITEGGTLLLDEAYELAKGKHGREAMSCIVAVTGNSSKPSGVQWIAAGYTKPIEKDFLGANPGLPGRFEMVKFHKYSIEELVRIFKGMCERDHYTVDADALDLLRSALNRTQYRAAEARAMANMLKHCKKVAERRNKLNVRHISKEIMTVAMGNFAKAYPEKPAPYSEESDEDYEAQRADKGKEDAVLSEQELEVPDKASRRKVAAQTKQAAKRQRVDDKGKQSAVAGASETKKKAKLGGRIQPRPSVQKRMPGVDDVMLLTVVEMDGIEWYVAAEIYHFIKAHEITIGIGKYKNAKKLLGHAEAIVKPDLEMLKECIDEESPLKGSRPSKLWIVEAQYVNNDLHLEDMDAE